MGQQESPHILVAGAGLAGLATAVWLAKAGHRVTLVEKRGRLGGRTISFEVPGIEGRVDNGQHLFAGCYEALLRYVDTIGSRDKLYWDAPPFAIKTGPDRLLTLRAPRWLPGPLRRAVGLSWMVWPPIPLRERPAALRTWARIARAALRPAPELDDLTVDRWFRQIGAPESLRALVLDQFVIGLLNEKTERVSASMFVQTLHWIGKCALSGNTRAGDAVWPRVSLHELFVAPAERYLRAHGAQIVVGVGVTDIEIRDDKLTGVRLSDGRTIEVDAAVLTLPPWSLTTLLDRGLLGRYDHFTPVRKIEPAPISSVYVWLDRPLGMRRLAENLRDTTIEWVFDTTGMHGVETGAGHCYSLAVSASWDVSCICPTPNSRRRHWNRWPSTIPRSPRPRCCAPTSSTSRRRPSRRSPVSTNCACRSARRSRACSSRATGPRPECPRRWKPLPRARSAPSTRWVNTSAPAASSSRTSDWRFYTLTSPEQLIPH
ncbi:FAD-dependent oxidoreductase [Nocardia mangyaensis]|nr:FAD-dependent oxidoreductase [Nocardia mangyaensis]MDO3646843.1 FAD-dependent oxidoreductase [Nocardia mangyaensis]